MYRDFERLAGGVHELADGAPVSHPDDGGPGDDVLPGTTGADVIAGLGGDDQISGLAGNDVLYGDARDAVTAVVAGADTLDGGADDDVLVGGAGDDHLMGGAGADVLFTGQTNTAQAAPYAGAAPGLTFSIAQDGGNDVLDGGDGTDTAYLLYTGRTGGVAVDLSHPELVAPILVDGVALGSIAGVEILNFYGGSGHDTVVGGARGDTLSGGAGDDQLSGMGGNDVLYGDAVDASAAVAAGADTLDGGEGDDVLVGGAGDDHLSGGAGYDVLFTGQTTTVQAEQYLGYGPFVTYSTVQDGGDDVLDGGEGADSAYLMYATRVAGVMVDASHPEVVAPILVNGVAHGSIAGVEVLYFYGGSGDDTVVGAVLGDTLVGGAGDDTLTGGPGGNNSINGGAGNDTLYGGAGAADDLDYGDAAAGVSVDLHLTTQQNTGGSGLDTLSGFEDLEGSAHDDHLTGDEGANLISSQGGSDTIAGAGGDDQLFYFASDAVGAPSVTVVMDGGEGNDKLTADLNTVADAVTLTGGAGDDTIFTLQGTRTIDAGSGDDLVTIDLVGGTADVTLGPGVDRIGQFGLFSGAGVIPAITVEDFQPGEQGDRLDLVELVRQLDPNGNPITDGYYKVVQSGDDTLVQINYQQGSSFSGTLFTLKNVTASALTWHNLGFHPEGGIGIDELSRFPTGTDGNDRLYATADGGSFVGAGGADLLTGRAGAQDFYFYYGSGDSPASDPEAAPTYDVIANFDPTLDEIVLQFLADGAPVTLEHLETGQTRITFDFDELGKPAGEILVDGFVQGGDVRNTGTVGRPSTLDLTLHGASTAEALAGGNGADVISGGGGADFLGGGAGADTFAYAAGDSTVAAPDYICDFQTGADKIDLSAIDPASVAVAYVGGYTVIGYPGSAGGPADQEIIVQGAAFATDLKLGAAFVGLTLSSDDQGRLLFGLGANDHLIGGAGADLIVGGGGSDLISGGGGADTFKYYAVSDSTAAAHDVITDFEHGTDKIDLTGGVAGGVLNIAHDGAGHSVLYYAPAGALAQGEIVVVGDVEDGDVAVDPGTVVFDTGAFAAPPPAHVIAFDHAARGHAVEGLHVYLA